MGTRFRDCSRLLSGHARSGGSGYCAPGRRLDRSTPRHHAGQSNARVRTLRPGLPHPREIGQKETDSQRWTRLCPSIRAGLPGGACVRRASWCIARSSVGVDHGSGLGTAPPPGHLKRVDDDLRGDAIADRPADDTARVGVDHGGAADPSVSRAVLRDVTEPVRRVCAELPLLREIALVREVHNDDVELLTEAVGAANPLLDTLREACPRDWRR